MKNKIIIILFFASTLASSQNIFVGVHLSPTLLLLDNSSNIFTPYSLSLTVAHKPTEWMVLEVRPGYLLGGEEFSGFDFGAYTKFQIMPSKVFLVLGLYNHSNNVSGHNSGGSYEKNMLFKSVGIGFYNDSKLSIDLSYSWADDNSYGYYWNFDQRGNSVFTEKKINAVLNIGLSLAWDVF